MDREALMQLLPLRDTMLLRDASLQTDVDAIGHYLGLADEWFLQGHFPGNPVVPGVVLCEILAQSVCVLLGGEMADGATPMYTGLNNVRFKSPVRPGDLFETRCRVTKVKKPFYFASGEGYVGERLCVKAEFSFAVVES